MAVTRIIRIQEVLHRCALTRASLYRQISNGSFPSQRLLSPYGRSVGWLEEDIERWISSRQPAKAVLPKKTMKQGISEMGQQYKFLTANPACIRHAGSDLERLSQQHPLSGSQPKAEAEQQRWLHVLTKAGRSNGKKLAEKLQACRNDRPCGSVACAHCQRERYLGHLDTSLPMMSASSRFACVELVFSEDAATQHPWRDMTQHSLQIDRYKQRIGRTLSRQGISGPVIGTFSILRHRFNGAEDSTLWFPKLRLLLPDNRHLLKGLEAHMTRGIMDSAGMGQIIPVQKLPARDRARTLGLVLDPREYVTDCWTEESIGKLKTGTPKSLKGGTLSRSLVMMDNMDFRMITFKYGMLLQKSAADFG